MLNLSNVNTDTVSNNDVPGLDSLLSELNNNIHAMEELFVSVFDERLTNIEDNQNELLELLRDESGYEPTPEELEALEQEEELQQQYDADLLEVLHSIDAGMVSQNALLEENKQLLENSMGVSENSVSQNALITTRLEDYSLTDSLLLVIIVLLLFSLLFGIFVRRS